jgi:Fe-S cluster biogenesis protein NfuA
MNSGHNMMNTATAPWLFYAEATPNPDAMKFVANRSILPGNSLEFTDSSMAAESPLAKELFRFSFVKTVFISQNFITILKHPGVLEWQELIQMVRTFLAGFFEEGNQVVTNKPQKGSATAATALTAPGLDPDTLSEIDKKIIAILDEYIRPAVEGDGGAITFRSFSDGLVTLVLQGSCSGCPSSTMTLKSGIEGLLRRMVPEVEKVVAENA